MVVNLMLITGENSFPYEEGKYNRSHYIAVKSLSRLLAKKNIKHEAAQHHCTNCLHGFPSKISRDNHERYCRNNKAIRIEMPMRKPYVKYSEGPYQLKVPFAMYADFESLLTKPSEEGKKRGIVNIHKPSGWCVKSKFAYGEVDNPIKMYRGKDCVEEFCKHIVSEAKRLHRSFPEKPMEPLTSKQIKAHSEAKVCHICF